MKVRLEEALTPEQKIEVSGWQTPHHEFSDHAFPSPSHERTIIPATFGDKGEHEDEVSEHLAKHGYKMHDYVSGTAIDKHGRTVKIGKALGKTEGGHLLDKFTNDPARKSGGNQSNYHIVISRHPYDVAGMTSKGHSWENQSCMNFADGANKKYLPYDVLHGTHVAYYTHKDDTEIEKPLARIALKPFINREKHVILRPETSVYGNASSAFDKSVSKWANLHFPAKEGSVYKKHSSLYHDSGSHLAVGPETANSIALDPHGDTKMGMNSTDYDSVRHGILISYPLHADVVSHVMRQEDSNAAAWVMNNKHAKMTDDSLSHAVLRHNMAFDAAGHHALGDKTVDAIYKFMDETRGSHETVRERLLSNPNFSASHVDKHLEWEKKDPSRHPAVSAGLLLRNPNLQDRHVREIVKSLKEKDPGNDERVSLHLSAAAVKSPKIQQSVLEHIQDQHLPSVANRWHMTGRLADTILDRAEKAYADPKIAGHAPHYRNLLAVAMINNPDVPKEHTGRIIKLVTNRDTGEIDSPFLSNIRATAMKKLTPEHITDIIKHGSLQGLPNFVLAASTQKLTDEHKDLLMHHKAVIVRGQYILHHPIKPHQMRTMFDAAVHPDEQSYLAGFIAKRSYDDQHYNDEKGYEDLDHYMINHPNRVVQYMYFHHQPNALKPEGVPKFVGEGKDAVGRMQSVYAKHPEMFKDLDVADFAMNHKDIGVVRSHTSMYHSHFVAPQRHADIILQKYNDHTLDFDLSRTQHIPSESKALMIRAIDRSAEPHEKPSDSKVNDEMKQKVGIVANTFHNAAYRAEKKDLPAVASHLVEKLKPLSQDPEVLEHESKGLGNIHSSGKVGIYNRLQRHIGHLVSHVQLPSESLEALYDHADVSNSHRIAAHQNASYDLWKKHRLAMGEAFYSSHKDALKFQRRFQQELLNEAVSFSKTKVWILE